MPINGRARGGEQDQNCDGNCIKRDIERVGEERRKRATDRKNWRLLIETVMTKMRGRKKNNNKMHCHFLACCQ